MLSVFHDTFQMVLLAIFPALVIFAALNDFRFYRIPNWLNLAIFGSFFPVALLLGMPWEIFMWHVIGFATVFGLMFVAFLLTPVGKFGGGDAKMIAAVSVWIDWPHLLDYGIMIAIAGGVLAVIMWTWRILQIEYGVWMHGDATLRKVMGYNIKLPYGAAIAAGGIYAYTLSWWQTLVS